MFYTCEKMKNVCRNFVKDMTISQLCRISNGNSITENNYFFYFMPFQ